MRNPFLEGRSSSRKLGKKLEKLGRFLIIIARLLDFFFSLVLLFLEFGFNRGSSHHRRVDREIIIFGIFRRGSLGNYFMELSLFIFDQVIDIKSRVQSIDIYI